MSHPLRRFPSPLAPLALGLMLLVGCSSPSPSTGSALLAASASQALSANDVTRVKVTVSASDMSSLVVELAKANNTWGGIIGNIPAGDNRSFLAEAFDASGTLRFQGQASGVTISANQTTAVALILQEIAPPPAYGNEAPVISSVVASSTSVLAGGTLSLNATVHDPNTGDTLTLLWEASGGSFSAPSAATTSWTAPASAGVQTLTFTATDSQGAAVSVSLGINVVAGGATGNAAINIAFNLWPVVSRVSASLNRLDAGQSTHVSALASDTDGDALSYQWTASCPGTWTDATASAASFVPSSVPANPCNNCRLTVTVQDGRGGQSTGSLHLCIAAAGPQHFAPLITNFYQSATATAPGQTVTFDVTALDTEQSSLSFAWTANTGSLAPAQTTASTSHVVWTAPACAPTGVTPTITATVTNAYGLSASKLFSLTGLPACPANEWAGAGSMVLARSGSTSTLLLSGKVLVTGSLISTVPKAAELYDPDTHSWLPAGAMAWIRVNHTATRLPSGKVLIAGGYNGNGFYSSTELYDPETHTWSAGRSMIAARYYHTATLLSSGKVLVTGGNGGTAFKTAEVYDPDTDTWSSAGTMVLGRYQHTATLLPSGKVLVTGGTGNGGSTAATELYDPDTNTWSYGGPMNTARHSHTATLLPSGRVLVVGGQSPIHASAELYHPDTNTWSSAGFMASPRRNHTATLLPSGQLFVTGGINNSGALATSEVYDPNTQAWSSAASMATARHSHNATLLLSGQVLIAGGVNGSALSSAERYTP